MQIEEMRALLVRVDQASGPDRGLDAEIDAAVHGGVPAHSAGDATRRSYGPGYVHASASGIVGIKGRSAPAYTVSIDAAVALLDQFGMSWSKSMEGFVCVHDREGAGTFSPDTESSALPIKLLSAAIRALLARVDHPNP